MHAASRYGTPSLRSLPKDGGVSCIGHSSRRLPIQFFDHTQPCLTSVKLMELAGLLGHSPCMKYIMTFKLGYEIEFQDYLKSLPTDVYMQKPEVVGWLVAGEQPTIVESKYFKVEEPLKV